MMNAELAKLRNEWEAAKAELEAFNKQNPRNFNSAISRKRLELNDKVWEADFAFMAACRKANQA